MIFGNDVQARVTFVVVRNSDGVPVATGQVVFVMTRQVRVSAYPYSGNYLRLDGRKVGDGKYTAKPVSEAEAGATEKEIVARLEAAKRAREAAEDAAAQAAYDALPESVKLAKALRWVCQIQSDATIATAPIELLRGFVEWARARNLGEDKDGVMHGVI